MPKQMPTCRCLAVPFEILCCGAGEDSHLSEMVAEQGQAS